MAKELSRLARCVEIVLIVMSEPSPNGRKSFWANLQEIDSMIQGNNWIMGKEFTVVDGYALVFYSWGARSEYPMKELSAYTAWQERMMQRRTVRKSVESEDSVSA